MAASIQPLPIDLVHQIAAGEVIDSLAAVVRELVENAIDAQARRITLSLWPQQGRVQVADDGCGIDYTDLLHIAAPHSTSKIRSLSDLWRVGSLGFRGQALHSLSQAGQLEICSRSQQPAASGWRVVLKPQAERTEPEAVAIAPGTIVTVTGLFSTWPQRRQALPALSQQLKAVQHWLQQIALCHPQITLQAMLDGAPWFAFSPAASAHQRLPQILKSLAASDLRELTWAVAAPAQAEAIATVGVASAVEAGPDSNAASLSHPDLGQIYLLVGLPDRCQRRRPDWIKIAVNGRPVQLPALEQAVVRAFRFSLGRDRYPLCFIHLQAPAAAIDWNRHPDKSAIYLRRCDIWQQAVAAALTEVLRLNPESLSPAGQQQRALQLIKAAEASGTYSDLSVAPLPNAPPTTTAASALPRLRATAQVQNRYIVAEHAGGICLIEQHIAHERVLYEQLVRQWQLVPLPQPVILPSLTAAQVDNLQQLQLELAPFGPQLWAVRTAPAALAPRPDLAEALLELSCLSDLTAALVATACRTALRNGTPLSLETMQVLLDDWQATDNPHTCPHGRPICLSLAETSLARFFKRHWVIGKSHGLEP